MQYFEWNLDKNALLKAERGIGFEAIQTAIEAGEVLNDVPHPKVQYRHQRIYIVEVNDYAYLVPYVTDGEKIFLKTIIPNREAMKEYLNNKEKGARDE